MKIPDLTNLLFRVDCDSTIVKIIVTLLKSKNDNNLTPGIFVPPSQATRDLFESCRADQINKTGVRLLNPQILIYYSK